MNVDDILREPDEHVRFAAYLDELRRVAEADETGVVSRVLTDPDQTMAQSAVLRHLDRRADDLHLGSAYEGWAQAMARTVTGYPLLTRRLQEWGLYRAITLQLPWHPDDLLAGSNWLQLKTAAESSTAAIEILAGGGRTKRIRNTATASLERQSKR
ncbi:hypothetical protein ACFW2V_30545 [Streptomyces sp. NPDC058947]|uniref:hypothetical protein n=1 Tax=Streptomyces sp. NPDC058947 TaxID=3346675 RepID=UPI0036AA192C